jgi:hypothetical protein
MKGAIKKKSSPFDPLDECCNIAESMMQEIQIIGLLESRLDEPTDSRRLRGSMKEKLMKRIRLLKEMSMMG